MATTPTTTNTSPAPAPAAPTPAISTPAGPVKVITAHDMTPPPAVPPVPKNASMADAFAKLEAIGSPDASTTGKAPLAPPEPPKDAPPPAEPAKDPPAEPAKPAEPPPPATPPADPPKRGKQNAWEVVDQYKNITRDLEREIADLRAKVQDPGKIAEIEKRAIEAEKRAKEYEEHMRFVDYTKSPEYVEKYEAPYKAEWDAALSTVKQLRVTVPDPANPDSVTTRPATAEDLIALANMPLQQMIDTVDASFGKASSFVLNHLTQLRSLGDKQQKALADAKRVALERHEQTQRAAQALESEVRSYWQEAEAEATEAHDFLRPAEGDDDWNKALAAGKEFVESAWSSAKDLAKLTPAERKDVVRRHAAMKNRALAYPTLKMQRDRARAEIESLKAELAKYKASTPPAGGAPPSPTTPPATGVATLQNAFDALDRMAQAHH